ncbi:MAG: ribbon-helix-helix protein, CopG family [Nitrospirota bacterium]
MKTTISIPDDMYKEIEKIAKESRLPRSEVIVTAVRERLEKRKSVKLFEAINKAFAGEETTGDGRVRQMSKKHYSMTVLKERP